MTDDLISVNVEETPIDVTIDSGTPVVTVSDENSSTTVTISADPNQVLIVNEQPVINIFPGSGSIMSKTTLMGLLDGSIDITKFEPQLISDLNLLGDLWLQVGRDINQLLTDADTDSIVGTATSYTDTQIQTIAVDIQRIDGDIAANQSSITQTASDINLRVDNFESDVNSQFSAKSAEIAINANNITSTVTSIDNLSGRVTSVESRITQEADRITSEIAARQALADGQVATNTSQIIQSAQDIALIVSDTNTLTNRMDSAELTISANSIIGSVLSETVNSSHKSVEALTANSYGVTLTENAQGNKYITGIELILHPAWEVDFNYFIDDIVEWTDTQIYKCILDHKSTTTNSPGGVDTATYWVLQETSAKSEFNVQVDNFNVIGTDGSPTPVFTVDTATNEVVVSGALTTPILKSSNYDNQIATESWFKLDETTGIAEFHNMAMTFDSSGLDEFKTNFGIYAAEQNAKDYADITFVDNVTYGTDIATIQNQIDGNITTWFYTNVPTLVNEPAVNWTTDADKNAHLGDLYYDDATGYAYRFQLAATVYSWVRITDSDITTALQQASNAQDTADHKRRVFVVQPTPPYDVGDLWTEGPTGELYRCVIAKTDMQAYSFSDWEIATKYTDDSALTNFINVTYAADLSDVQNQIDGKIVSWFTLSTSDPSTTWSGTDSSHTGDMWWTTDTKKLYRWEGTAWSSALTDQTAIDAYANAAAAQDTADEKRRVFVATPTGPYDPGDLWDTGSGIYRATIHRDTGYLASEWTLIGDVTQSALDLGAAIDNAKVNGSTLIEGGYLRNSLIQTNTLIVGGIIGQGSLATSNTADWSTQISGIGKPADNADVTSDNTSAAVAGQEVYRCYGIKYSYPNPLVSGHLYNEKSQEISGLSCNTRSYILDVYDRATKTWDSHTSYDLYADSTQALALATALNALDDSKIVVVSGQHAPGANRLLSGLPEAIYRCGGSKTVFEGEDWSNAHPTYCLIGVPGSGDGAGIESFSKASIGYFDVTFIIKNGNLITTNKTSNFTPGADITDYSDERVSNIVAENTTKSLIKNVTVGGRNLITAERMSNGSTLLDVNSQEYTRSLQYGGTWRVNSFTQHDNNEYYSVSFKAKASVNTTLNIDVCDANMISIPITTDYTLIKNENILVNSEHMENTYKGFIDFSPNDTCELYIKELKIEKGSKATAWTPAPEDIYVDNRVSNNITENNITTISRPVGGVFSSNTPNLTGAILITLPQGRTATMLRFFVDVYNYVDNKSFSLAICGYTYISEWLQTSVQLFGDKSMDNAVRFCYDGSKCCITIGETNSVWQYPKVVVRDFQAGYSNYGIDNWKDGWNVSIVTTLPPTIDVTKSDNLIDANAVKTLVGSDLEPAEKGAQTTTATTVANAIGGQAYIETGIIRNSGNTLSINLDTATITVKSANGLIIDSTGGMTVNGSIDVNNGGDINFTSTNTNQSYLNFTQSTSNTTLSYGFSSYSTNVFEILSGGDNTALLDIGSYSNRFNKIEMNAYQIQIDGQSLITHDSDCMVYRGLKKRTQAEAVAYASTVLLNNGEFFYYVDTATEHPMICFKWGNGISTSYM